MLTGLRALAIADQSFFDAYRKLLRRRWTMQACTTVWGQTWATADGRCFSPSHTSMHTSFTPRFFISVNTFIQYLAPSPSPCSPAHNPSTSRSPSQVTARAT